MPALTPLRVLLVEDHAGDLRLMVRGLRQAGFLTEWHQAQTEDGFERALAHDPQVVIAGYSVPGFGALSVLRAVAERGADLPVIVVSNELDEELCVESLRRGAADYLLKHRLARLGSAVQHALLRQRLRAQQREAERRAREHLKLFQATFDHGPIGMAVVAPDQHIIEANAALCRLTGLMFDEISELTFDSLIRTEDRLAVRAYIEGIVAARRPSRFLEVGLVTRTGATVWAQLTTSCVRGPDGHPRHLIHQIQDITERHAADLARRTAMATLQCVVDNAPAIISLVDLDGRFLLMNTEFERRNGVRREAAIGQLLEDVLPAPAAAVLRDRAERCVRNQQPIRVEEPSLAVPDTVYLSSQYPVLDANDVPYAVGEINVDISDLKRTEHALRKAQRILRQQADQLVRTNAELQEVDLLKTEFVASVSHELRTPLTSIRGYAELLLNGRAGPLTDKQLRIVRVMERSGHALRTLIEDLLTVSSIDSGAFRLTAERVDVGVLAARVHETLAPLVDAAGQRMTVTVQPGMPPVQADPGQLERAILNVAANAVKFTPPGGTVTLSAGVRRGDVVISVADSGVGIPPEEQDRVFERFYRTASARQHQVHGSGLGLSIVKSVMDHHHGWIELESTPGVGTTVTLGLPLAGAGRAAAPVPVSPAAVTSGRRP